MDDLIVNLEMELASLKRQRKEEKAAAKVASTWVNVKRSLPGLETHRVVAWANGQMERCWFADGKFYVYDGTWLYTSKDLMENVTHWMARDWMSAQQWPAHGPGVKNRMRHYWRRAVWGAQDMASDLRPKSWGGNAQLSKKVTFYKDASGKLMTGLPDYMPAPQGYEKIVCNNVFEAERYSNLQRRQEGYEHRQIMEERASIEGGMRDDIRREMHTKMANARNNVNREFMRRALENNANRRNPWEYHRESYLHAEGYEDRK